MTKNTVPAAAAQLDRKALMARSKALHALGGQHFRAAMPFLSSARAQGHAKRFSLLRAKAWTQENNQAVFVIELAAWIADEGRGTAVQRYARQQAASMTFEDVVVLAGMQMSVISFWTVQEEHPVAGWIVRDLLNDGTAWVVDETLRVISLMAHGPTSSRACFGLSGTGKMFLGLALNSMPLAVGTAIMSLIFMP